MNRRSFINKGIGVSMLSILPWNTFGNYSIESPNPTVIKPQRLKKGDKVGLIAPGWMITQNQLDESVNNLEILGFQSFYTKRILGKYGYYSGPDQDRADDINEMFSNPDIKGIFCAHGGYGCTRLLRLLDFSGIKENPKLIIGFSDATAFLNAINQQTGLVTFHGPISRTIQNDFSKNHFENVAINPKENYLIESCPENAETILFYPEFSRYTINSGIAKGRLVGGNLSIICSLIGTKHQLDFTGKIVFIEDIGEEPYRIDRMLTQLIEIGALQKAAGLAFGVFKGCGKTDKSLAPNSFDLQEVINERIKPLNIPAVYGLSFGHYKNNFTIPIGINAKLDADKMTIELLENAVH
jgi:muramoyltetrapeptide carboxypeptidase